MTQFNGHVTKGKGRYYKYTLLAFIVIFTASFIILFASERNIRKAIYHEAKVNEVNLTNLESQFVDRELNMAMGDLNYLKEDFISAIESGTPYETTTLIWEHFSFEKKLYDQIRFINMEGYEEIRVNYEASGSYTVPNNQLQYKGDRDYYNASIALNEDEVYVSAIELNIENGTLEIPYNPVLRIAVPVFIKGQREGFIVLNYFAEDLLKRFRSLAEYSGGEVFLLNDRGYSVSSDREGFDWEFALDNASDSSFKNEFSGVWDRISQGETQFSTDRGLFTAKRIDLQQLNEDDGFIGEILSNEKLYIVTFIDRSSPDGQVFYDDSKELMKEVLIKYVAYYLLILLIAIVIGFMITINRTAYHKIKFYSEFDPLTQVYNRRAGMEKLQNIFTNTSEECKIVTICFLDINGLKQVNDTLGHQYGDELITTSVQVIRQQIREKDILIRLGGDEFLIAFHNMIEEETEAVWQRIVSRYNEINAIEERAYLISVSHGLVSYNTSQANQIDALISEADQRMYSEKEIIKRSLNVIKDQV